MGRPGAARLGSVARRAVLLGSPRGHPGRVRMDLARSRSSRHRGCCGTDRRRQRPRRSAVWPRGRARRSSAVVAVAARRQLRARRADARVFRASANDVHEQPPGAARAAWRRQRVPVRDRPVPHRGRRRALRHRAGPRHVRARAHRARAARVRGDVPAAVPQEPAAHVRVRGRHAAHPRGQRGDGRDLRLVAGRAVGDDHAGDSARPRTSRR